MNIIEAIKYVDFKDVKRALRFHYPKPPINKHTMDRYKEIMEEISGYKNDEIKNKQLRVDLVCPYKYYNKTDKKWVWLVEIGGEYYTTHMKKKGEKMCYAIDFTRWEESSQWKIANDVLKRYTLPEILAHYLWEITFCGFVQNKVQKKGK